jgi:hypothetical protein
VKERFTDSLCSKWEQQEQKKKKRKKNRTIISGKKGKTTDCAPLTLKNQ